MKEDIKNIIIFGVIVILGAYLVFYTPLVENIFMPKPNLKKAEIPAKSIRTDSVPSSEAARVSTAEAKTEKAAAQKFVILRDPFEVGFEYRKAETTAPLPGTGAEIKPAVVKKYLVLQGIFIAVDTKIAIIDDKVVYEGSSVAGGYKVFQIKDDYVVIKKGKKIKTLRLK